MLEPFATDDETFDVANEYPATFETDKSGHVLDTATITITASAKKAPGTIQVADSNTPKKPTYAVVAGEMLEIPFERVLGSDGLVGVKVEGSGKGVESSLSGNQFEWADGDTGRKVLSVTTKTFAATDYTASKKLSIKLTALKSAKNDAVQYDKPTIAAPNCSFREH